MQRESERRRLLGAALPAAVDCLVNEFGVTKVVLFGSLARGDAGLHSDVDLLVDGLPREKLFEAMARLARELGAGS
jgi:predicted nucleotidyltransferase